MITKSLSLVALVAVVCIMGCQSIPNNSYFGGAVHVWVNNPPTDTRGHFVSLEYKGTGTFSVSFSTTKEDAEYLLPRPVTHEVWFPREIFVEKDQLPGKYLPTSSFYVTVTWIEKGLTETHQFR